MSEMRTQIKPKQVIPAEYSVHFKEYDKRYKGYLIEPQPYETRLNYEIEHWLNDNAPGYQLVIDRGDWGEGPASVIIRFQTKKDMSSFVKKFAKGNCDEIFDCKNLVEYEEKNFKCSVCNSVLKLSSNKSPNIDRIINSIRLNIKK